jgi:methionyl-tRNA formyltransferase
MMTAVQRSQHKILFMGTPDFAVASLQALHEAGYNICGIVTTPDKPAGRGRKLQACPVKEYALDKGFPIIEPENLNDPKAAEEVKKLNADLGVVVAFKKLPEAIFLAPKKGTFNLHGSLLPAYRGAAPIHRAIMNGEIESGVTTFLLNDRIDEGQIFYKEAVEISSDMNTSELYAKLMTVGASLVVKTADDYLSGKISPTPQPMLGNFPKAPKIFREDCKIDWNKTIDEVHNHIRGLSLYPGAFSELIEPKALSIKILKSSIISREKQADIATPIHRIEKGWKVYFSDGILEILKVQPQGKGPMPALDFVNGFPKGSSIELVK